MQAIQTAAPVSVEEYLSGEQQSELRHEYVGGAVYAMAGASSEHNVISLNLASSLRSHLQGKRCQVFIADVKLRLQLTGDELFYYPDVMVACDPRDTDRFFKRYPKVLIEVLSEATETTDRREKLLSYKQIDTLEEYVLVAQDKVEVTVHRRASKWQSEVLRQAEQELQLASIEFHLPLAAVYEGIKL